MLHAEATDRADDRLVYSVHSPCRAVTSRNTETQTGVKIVDIITYYGDWVKPGFH